MRIVTAKQFEKEPYGTVYIHYQPRIYIGQPKIKSEPRGTHSWYATDVLPWVTGDEEFAEWEKYPHDSLETEGFCTDDATYNHDDELMYAIFDKEEVRGMIDRLIESLYESEKYNK